MSVKKTKNINRSSHIVWDDIVSHRSKAWYDKGFLCSYHDDLRKELDNVKALTSDVDKLKIVIAEVDNFTGIASDFQNLRATVDNVTGLRRGNSDIEELKIAVDNIIGLKSVSSDIEKLRNAFAHDSLDTFVLAFYDKHSKAMTKLAYE